ncbi:hypothetical protein H5410_024477 [Solanum commersonii]|uniref:Cytochrome P450 n=1 Tax=Solanum commersonii TaxID=4109 RepID=A0A9J5ZM46_SOLCO|nr:hypothetical protein H5410_024477 [Solanum commersonii]
MKQWFENLALTIIIRMLFGKEHDFEEGKRARNVMTNFFKLLGAFVVADFIPSLRWLDIGGYEKEMKKNAKEIDYILEKWLVEHKKKRSCGENKCEDDKDFMDIMLSLFEDAMDEDLAAIAKESLRLYPPGPLSAPHESIEDCIVGGYNIPKGTRVLFNLWKIQRDPTVWPEPDLFKPERFLTTQKDIDVKGNHFELIPFGAGRRICPGISSTLVLLHLTLANVLHAFEITRPSDEPIDMTASFGTKTTPLEVLIAPRLSPDFTKKGTTPPKVAGSWPIIGHLHLFNGSKMPHKTLGLMADKYGPIFTVKFGSHQVVVVNNRKIAQDCFTTNDKALASRPKSLALEVLGYNYALFGMGPYCPYWREMKKIVVLELLSNHRVQMHRHIREFEVKTSLKQIYTMMNGSPNTVKIEMNQWFENLTMNVIVRILFGKEHDFEVERARKAIRTFMNLFRVFVVADYMPSLRWLDIGGYEKEMKENAKEIDYILEKWLVEHKKKRSCGEKKSENDKDFMDIMLSLFEDAMDEDVAGFDADTIIKSTCLAMWAGGSDTIVVALIWILSLLLNNPHVMKKAQEEIDIQVGRNKFVDESHINNLVYLQAITKESLRLYPPGPLSVPHESMEDCTVDDYIIPKGTRVLFNLWMIQRDPTIWSEPDVFKPERFLTTHKDVDVKGKHFELIPFGAGRRICPGISTTLVLLHLTLANVLHAFEITRPYNEPIDMSANLGIKETPLESINVPEAAGAWPIIGHLHLLNAPQMPHKIFGQMAETYGPIFRLKLGVNEVVIVSDHKIAKECFTTNDRAFANRPKSIASEILGYNYAMFGLGPYGPYWREIRKIVTIEFLSARRIEMLKHVREFEVKSAVKETYEYWLKNNLKGAVKIEMKEWFGNLIMNTMVKLLFGVQYTGNEDEERSKAHKAIRRLFELLGAFVVADFLPYLRWLDIGGHEKAMKETAKEIDFIALQTAGTDTTIVTLIWIFSLLLNNHEALKKAQDELDTHIGKNRWVQESDIKNLVYLQAIVKESLRLYSPGPLLLPHESRIVLLVDMIYQKGRAY